jgi:hypothetical protein
LLVRDRIEDEMATQTVTVEFPEHLYRELQSRAAQAQRTIEDELLATFTMSMPENSALPADFVSVLDSLALLDNDSLWRAARSRLATEAAAELEELHQKQQREGLTAQEAQAEAALIRQYERAMLVRAQAAALLHDRGEDISGLLQGS